MTRTRDVTVLVGITVGCSLYAQSHPRPTPQALARFSASIEDLAQASSPAVVQITVRGRAPLEEGGVQRTGFTADQRATGSGVIVDPDGYIVTNAHVVIDARHVDVSVIEPGQPPIKPSKRKHFPAPTVGLDREADLAVLKIESKGLPTLSFLGETATLKQGQLVLALGSPLGLDNSLTVGFVSAPVRQLSPDKPNFYIQTDAPINPGNSGGPLLDIAGHIAGINTMIMSQSCGSEGIGFAIPSNVVQRTYHALRKDGRIRRGTIGVIPRDLTPILASALGLDRDSGIILSDIVPHGAAEAAGSQPGDVVLAIDGKPLERSSELMAAVFQHVFGEEITLDIQRGRERLKKTVAVLARPKSPDDLEEIASRDAHLIRRLGVLALTLDEKVTPILPDPAAPFGCRSGSNSCRVRGFESWPDCRRRNLRIEWVPYRPLRNCGPRSMVSKRALRLRCLSSARDSWCTFRLNCSDSPASERTAQPGLLANVRPVARNEQAHSPTGP